MFVSGLLIKRICKNLKIALYTYSCAYRVMLVQVNIRLVVLSLTMSVCVKWETSAAHRQIAKIDVPSNFFKSVRLRFLLCNVLPEIILIWDDVYSVYMKYVQNIFGRNIYGHSKFSCVHSSHDLCSPAHVHSLEGTLAKMLNDDGHIFVSLLQRSCRMTNHIMA